jgi:hypothetical protein
MNTQTISTIDQPSHSIERIVSVVFKIVGVVVALGILAYAAFWIFVWYAFKDWHFEF